MNRLIGIALTVAILGCGTDDDTGTVQRTDFESTIVETGSLRATQYAAVAMPAVDWSYGRPKIAKLIEEGSPVKKGGIIGEVETAGVVRELGLNEVELEIAQAERKQLLSKHANALKNAQQKIKSANASLAAAAIDTKRVQFESDGRKERSRLRYRKAELTLQKAQQDLIKTEETQLEELLIRDIKTRRLDAYPSREFLGNVTSVSTIGGKAGGEATHRTFDVEILLDVSDPLLKPRMTVRSEIVVADLREVLVVDNASIWEDSDGAFVYVDGLFGRKRVDVEVGPRSLDDCVIRGDVEAGDTVILKAPGAGT